MDGVTYEYVGGLKRQIVKSLTPLLGSTFPVEQLRDKIYVGLEYPWKQIEYPAIYVTFDSGSLRNVGVGHYELNDDDNGITRMFKHFSFTGQVNFNVMALSPLDRDRIASILVNIIAFSPVVDRFNSFWEDITNDRYIQIHVIGDAIQVGGEQVGDAPWGNETERVYGNSFSIPLFGEFYSDSDSGALIEIDEILVTPYILGQQPVPWN